MNDFLHRGSRPGPEWHAHGTTPRTVHVLHRGELVSVRVRKQRWKHAATGRTCHDRPPWEAIWAAHGLDVILVALGTWLAARRGLHHVDWPWGADRPARRTAQRWLRRMARDADAWLHSLRLAAIENISPRSLEEIVPAGGIPPPGRRWRGHKSDPPNAATKLHGGIWLTKAVAEHEHIPIRTLLVEAKARWPGSTPTTSSVPRA